MAELTNRQQIASALQARQPAYSDARGRVFDSLGRLVYDPAADPTNATDPTAGMSQAEKLLAGTWAGGLSNLKFLQAIGRSFIDVARNPQQTLFTGSPGFQQVMADFHRLNAPLQNTLAGGVGYAQAAPFDMMIGTFGPTQLPSYGEQNPMTGGLLSITPRNLAGR